MPNGATDEALHSIAMGLRQPTQANLDRVGVSDCAVASRPPSDIQKLHRA
jgi:hypothetical protein